MGRIVDKAFLELDGREIACKSLEVKGEDGTEVVEAMTRDGEALGFTSGTRKHTGSAEFSMRRDLGVDPLRIWYDKKEFPVRIEYDAYTALTYQRARFSDVSVSSEDGQAVTYKCELKLIGPVFSNPSAG